MDILLDPVETRVLGSLIEKELTTPAYYPLSLNALVNACNQKSNRDPFMNLDEESVRQALRNLNHKELAGPADSDGRVTKYEHRLQEAFNFTRHETAIICELLLRGPQTPGELRNRAERMHRFDDLGIVQSTLQRLMKREPSLVTILPKLPGTKEARYAHLLSGEVHVAEPAASASGAERTSGIPTDRERITQLEEQVITLRQEVEDLRQQFAVFRKQFE